MKIDHLVVNVDRSVHEDKNFVKKINSLGLPYEPKWGKGTKGFKVSNLWIGNEYFEMVRISYIEQCLGKIHTYLYLKGYRFNSFYNK